MYHLRTENATQRLNITLDRERASKLSQLPARVHVTEGPAAVRIPVDRSGRHG
ncbi:MAG: hypothetical protein ACR2KP_17710 [Egibacteraceae bacterium]